MRSKRVLFAFNYYKCYSCDNIIGSAYIVGIKGMGLGNGNRKKSHCFIVSNVTHHELNNLTGEKQFREKEITTEKEMILLMRWKHVFFGTRSRFLPIGLNTFFTRIYSAKGYSEVFILKHKQIVQWDLALCCCSVLWYLVKEFLLPNLNIFSHVPFTQCNLIVIKVTIDSFSLLSSFLKYLFA